MATAQHNIALDIIYRMMVAFASSSDDRATIQQGLAFVLEAIGAEAASYFALDAERGCLTCIACLGPVDIAGLEIPQAQGIIGRVVESDAPRFIADVARDPDFDGAVDSKTGFATRSMICAPVSGYGRMFGAMQLINRVGGGLFDKGDASLVSALGKSAALALANSEMTQAMVEARLLKRDLSLASRVQQNLFPPHPHRCIAGINIPQKGVSGDLFDYVLRGERVYFCMGDVSGKGIDAALVMSKTHSLFRSLSRIYDEPSALAAAINRELVETAFDGMFVTVIIGVYDPKTGATQMCNIGHEPGLVLYEDGRVAHIEASLQPLGIMDFAPQELEVVDLSLARARLFCFSDGLTEAEIDGAMVGRAHIADLLTAEMASPIEAQVREVAQTIAARADRLADDVTLLGVGAPSLLSHIFDVTIGNDVGQLRTLWRKLDDALRPTRAVHRCDDIRLVVSEAAQNIIQHGFREAQSGTIRVLGQLTTDALVVVLEDTADPIDISTVHPRALDALREGGLGTHFMSALTRDLEWSHWEGGNRLKLVFAL